MAEPSTPQTPFDPAAPRGGPGCSKPLLIGCGVALLLLAISAVVVMVNLPAITGWWFGKMEASLATHLAPDVTPAERQRLHAAFAAAGRAAANGKVDLNKMPAFQRQLLEKSDPQRRLSRKDVQDLTRTLEDLIPPPASHSPPSPSPPSGSPSSPSSPPPPRR